MELLPAGQLERRWLYSVALWRGGWVDRVNACVHSSESGSGWSLLLHSAHDRGPILCLGVRLFNPAHQDLFLSGLL